jgi:hypothetical protein
MSDQFPAVPSVPPVPPVPPAPAPAGGKKGLAIAALVLGIISLCMAPIPVITLLAWPGSIVAIVLGILGVKSSGKGMAIAGIILGVVALILLIGLMIFNLVYGQQILNNLNL